MSNLDQSISVVTFETDVAPLLQLLDAQNQPLGTIHNFDPSLLQGKGGVRAYPAGVAVDPEGNRYVTWTLDQESNSFAGYISVLDRAGKVANIIRVPTGPTGVMGLTGVLWNNGWLYVLGHSDLSGNDTRILKIDPSTNTIARLQPQGVSGFRLPYAIVQDCRGDRYITDAGAGAIFKLSRDDSSLTLWTSGLSSEAGPLYIPGVGYYHAGATGMAFDPEEKNLYVTNLGNRQVVQIPVQADGSAGPSRLFIDGATVDKQQNLHGPVALYGADGLAFDMIGNLCVASNVLNEIHVYSPSGRLIQRYSASGAAMALDSPSNFTFRGHHLYISSLPDLDRRMNRTKMVSVAHH
jgi:sugar lactone lactonase YvrE